MKEGAFRTKKSPSIARQNVDCLAGSVHESRDTRQRCPCRRRRAAGHHGPTDVNDLPDPEPASLTPGGSLNGKVAQNAANGRLMASGWCASGQSAAPRSANGSGVDGYARTI